MSDFEKIGKYEITDKLGQGSFGVVYKGYDAYLKRDVAVKICSVEDDGLRQRFFREAEISGKLVHKNIVTVYEFGFEGKVPYLVQEMLSGRDLSRLIKRQAPVAAALKLDYLLQVANGLGYAHSEGVIHRDIKPSNIRVLEDGQVKIMDFGIAKLASAETQLTQKGVTMGTASYLPPEQVRGSDLDHRADVFSFGVLAYEMLTYQRPFRGNTLSALIYQILYKVPQPMGDVWAECPGPLSNLIAKCLEKKPERRFGSFSELIPELSNVRDEVLAGKWPALRAGGRRPGGPAAAPPEPNESSDVLSQTAIAKTARGVLAGKVGDYTISTAVSAPEVMPPPDSEEPGRSTRPIDATPADATPDEATPDEATPVPAPSTGSPADAANTPADDTLKTRVMATPPAPLEDSPEVTPVPSPQELAREIGDLVARGDLAAAKEQLEATLNRTGLAGLPPPPPPPSPQRQVDPTRKTRILPREEAPGSDLPPAELEAPVIPGATDAVSPDAVSPDAVSPDAVSPDAVSPDTGPPDAAASDTYRTVIRPPLHRLKWIGLAAAAVLVTGLGWALLGGRGEEAVEPVEPPPVPPPAEEPTTLAAPVSGGVAIHAAPWAEVTEVTDAHGFVQDLPEAASTPLYLELAPGTYRIQLRPAAGEEIVTCDVEVTPGAIASCAPALGETSVTDYFRESGWWD